MSSLLIYCLLIASFDTFILCLSGLSYDFLLFLSGTERGMFVALGRNKNPTVNKRPIDNASEFLAASNLKPFIPKELERSWTPIKFRLTKGGDFLEI